VRLTIARSWVLGAALVLAWTAGARGIELAPWAAVLTVATVAWLMLGALRHGLRVGRVHLLGAGMVGWMVIAALLRPVAPASAAVVVATAGVAVVLLLVTASPLARDLAAAVVVAVGTISGLVLIVMRMGGEARPAGLFGNPNLSALVAFLGLTTAGIWRRAPALVRGAAAVLALAGIFASGSRGVLLAVLVAAAVASLGRFPVRVRAALGVLAALALVGLGVRLVRDRDPLRWERVRIWQVGLATVRAELPWGSGPSGFEDAAAPHNFPRDGEFARWGRNVGVAESDPLQLVATLGLPGLLLLLGSGAALAGPVRRAGPGGWAMIGGVAVATAVDTTLIAPVVVWTLALAVSAALPLATHRLPPRRDRCAALLMASASLVAGVALAVPAAWPGGSIDQALTRASSALQGPGSDEALADGEFAALRLTQVRPRWGQAWRTLAALELRRGQERGDTALIAAAAEAYAAARRVNPQDAWAAFGEGRALRSLGRGAQARVALTLAVTLEPNLAPGWYELAVLALQEGRLDAARAALERLDMAVGAGPHVTAISDYERSLARVDETTVERLRAAVGSGR